MNEPRSLPELAAEIPAASDPTPAELATIADDHTPSSHPVTDAWLKTAFEGFARMDRDPEYRRHIQSRVS